VSFPASTTALISKLGIISVGIFLIVRYRNLFSFSRINLNKNYALALLFGFVWAVLCSVMTLKTSGDITPNVLIKPIPIAQLISALVIAPILEELLFRGWIFGYLKHEGVNVLVAILVSSLLFAAIHTNTSNVYGSFILGLVLAFIYHRTNNLFYVITAHFAINLGLIITPYSIIKNSFITDSTFGFITVTLMLLVVLMLIVYFMVKSGVANLVGTRS